MSLHYGLVQEAARIICEERVTDYRLAKLKALERLGLPPRAALPDNAQIQQAVIEYQHLFGGDAYHQHLRLMRRTALRVMKVLAEFDPRLVGGAVSGAVTDAHRVQLHLFAEKPEVVDMYLHNRGMEFAQDERSYRYAGGREVKIPLLRFDVDGIGVDVAVFGPDDQRRAPVSPADGLPFKRLNAAQIERLLQTV